MLRPRSPEPAPNTIWVPSGDQLGSKQPPAFGSEPGPPHPYCGCAGTSRSPVPLKCTIHIELCTSGVTCRENTMLLPCGDHPPPQQVTSAETIWCRWVPLVLMTNRPLEPFSSYRAKTRRL